MWLLIALLFATPAQAQPYPPSEVITDVTFDRATHDRRAPGSDNWPMTWADDGHQYTSWGDGGGFGGTNSNGRVSLGVGRVEGDFDVYSGFNVWGGLSPETPATFDGKSYGLISIEGVLYMWVSPGSNTAGYARATLYSSDDHGLTWTAADWSFTDGDDLVFPTILQFGRDYAGARDGFMYSYSIRLKDDSSLTVQTPGEIDLLRVPIGQIMERSAWEFFSGVDGAGDPMWSSDVSARQPVFEDAQGVGWNVSVSFNAPLGRYILCTEHDTSIDGNLGIFDAPQPWGPWTTVGYYDDWESFGSTFYWNFPNKWLSADGLDFTLVFTGTGENDSWNSIRGRFTATPLPMVDGGTPSAPDGGRPGTDASTARPDATTPGSDGGGPPPAEDDGGCDCSTTSSSGGASIVVAALVLLLTRRRAR